MIENMISLVKTSHELMLEQIDSLQSMSFRINGKVISCMKYYEAIIFIESETSLDLSLSAESIERLHTWLRFMNSKVS